MAIFNTEKKELPPVMVLALLSAIFPGAGHLAIKQNVKGWIFIGASAILFVMLFYYLAFIIGPIQTSLMAGREPEIDDAFMENVIAIGYVLGSGLFVWIAALIDVVLIGKRLNKSSG